MLGPQQAGWRKGRHFSRLEPSSTLRSTAMTSHPPCAVLTRHPPVAPGRRQFLGDSAALGLAAALGGLGSLGAAPPDAWAATAKAPALLLAHEAPADVEPQGFLVSEKLDGVRALWDGATLLSRGGHVIQAPAWFLAALPPVPLDGELWGGRGQFESSSGTVRRSKPVDAQWRALRYVAFELPQGEGTFAQRAQRLQALAAASAQGLGALKFGPNHGSKQTLNHALNAANTATNAAAPSHAIFQAAEQRQLPNRAALQAWLAEVLRQGGEGLMLHRADAPYLTGRSRVLLKLKPEYDAEAFVLGYQAGQGRLAGRMGALHVRNAQGAEFLIGTGFSDAERLNPPPVGSQVSYRHRGHTEAGIPRFASFWRALAS